MFQMDAGTSMTKNKGAAMTSVKLFYLNSGYLRSIWLLGRNIRCGYAVENMNSKVFFNVASTPSTAVPKILFKTMLLGSKVLRIKLITSKMP